MDKVVIRKLKRSDAKDLLEMYNSLVREKTMTAAVKKLSLKQEKEFIDKKLKDRGTVDLVLVVNKKTLGICGIRIEDPVTKHVGKLGILLKKDARGKGFGFNLTNETIRAAKKKLKLKIILLNVSHRNKTAISLYKKLGFKGVGKIKKGLNFFGRYDDNIIMAKYLF